MKLRAVAKTAFALAVIICGLFFFLFYTRLGLLIQVGAALEIQRVYLRFLTARATATREFFCQHNLARQLYSMGFNDLLAAHDVASAAIAQRQDGMEFKLRARIAMSTLSYSNAVADFEQALRLWNQGLVGDLDFNLQGTSNSLEIAKACAAAQEKYRQYWKNRPENPRSGSESIPPPSGGKTGAE
jgi:hypothetical protein